MSTTTFAPMESCFFLIPSREEYCLFDMVSLKFLYLGGNGFLCRKEKIRFLPPSDEGGGWPQASRRERKQYDLHSERIVQLLLFSLPQSASLTAPSSEGAKSMWNHFLQSKTEPAVQPFASSQFFPLCTSTSSFTFKSAACSISSFSSFFTCSSS